VARRTRAEVQEQRAQEWKKLPHWGRHFCSRCGRWVHCRARDRGAWKCRECHIGIHVPDDEAACAVLRAARDQLLEVVK
jgi:hypothetical protein